MNETEKTPSVDSTKSKKDELKLKNEPTKNKKYYYTI